MTVDQILIALRRAAENDYSLSVSPYEAAALVAEASLLKQEARIQRAISDGLAAEVEHLRVEVEAAIAEAATMRAWAEDARRERVAVVAWLRRVATDARDWSERADLYDAIADNIESGEHRREEKP